MPDEDAIMPDDFQEAQPQAKETQELEQETEQPITEVEDTKPTTETEQPEPVTQEPQKLKIKYNSEEKEIPLDEAAALAQKGLNYEKAVERAKQEARDAYIAEQGHTWNGKPITTEAEYKQAVMEQDLMEKYRERDLPEEVIQELVENRKFREEYETQRKTKAEEDRRNAELDDFLSYFQRTNDRLFDPAKDTVPQEVLDANASGVPLRFAYIEHQNKQLMSQLKVTKQNEENLRKAPIGSVTANGSADTAQEDDFMKGFNSD